MKKGQQVKLVVCQQSVKHTSIYPDRYLDGFRNCQEEI
jgi:intracellular sulfur oxidation DsrE/DsrF family protein